MIDRTAGMCFSIIFMMLGWVFAPFDTQRSAAFWVSVTISAIGLCALIYFDVFCSQWWRRKVRKLPAKEPAK